jgi:hypothetical protein
MPSSQKEAPINRVLMCSLFLRFQTASLKRRRSPSLQNLLTFAARSAAWSPRKEDKWFCECGNEWNTFDTGGVCPACLHQWTETQCLSCSRWSPHSDWYAHS